jgi:ferritin-like metal-binding protein YciE
MSDPRQLLLHQLADILYAESLLVKALPKLAREATNEELREGFEHHLTETKQQIRNLKAVFESLGEKPKAERCPGMTGIADEHDQFMSKAKPSPEIRDVFLTGTASRTEHYEIAAYTGLINSAEAVGEMEAVTLLGENLAQERAALEKMEALAQKLAKQPAAA